MKWSKTFWFQIEFMDGKNYIARKKHLPWIKSNRLMLGIFILISSQTIFVTADLTSIWNQRGLGKGH